jgi:UDP-N-acetylmuramate dehydrogenase
MHFLDDFAEITKLQEPLAPYTSFKLGGPAQFLVQPRSPDELARLIARCRQEQVPYRILGGGCNVLVRDEGVRGVVIRLSTPGFASITVQGTRVRAAAGAPLSGLISESARHALAGLESLIGIPGTVGGALRANAGSRSGYMQQFVRRVEVLEPTGQIEVQERDRLDLDPPSSAPDDAVILAAEFELESDDPDSILKRLRRFWIHKKAQQPLSFQAAGRIFADPRGLAADQLIEQAGLKGTRVGGAEVSERHANFIIAHPGATARDVLRLIDLVRSRVEEQFGQTLPLAIVVW